MRLERVIDQAFHRAAPEDPTPAEVDLDLYAAGLLEPGHQVLFRGELRTIARAHHLPPSKTNPAGAVALDFETGTDGRARTGLFQPNTLLKGVV